MGFSYLGRLSREQGVDRKITLPWTIDLAEVVVHTGQAGKGG